MLLLYFFILLAFAFLLIYIHQISLIRSIRQMSVRDKTLQINTLLQPFGFFLLPARNLISSLQNSWQRTCGYHALFDRSAPHFNMVFDCEPVYFDYDGRTWLIEFWKGQYGINTGCEIGIYHADTLLDESQYETAHFEAASDQELMPVRMRLYRKEPANEAAAEPGRITPAELSDSTTRKILLEEESAQTNVPLLQIGAAHWWLTAFLPGLFSQPEDLTMTCSLTFPDFYMQQSFLGALLQSGYRMREITSDGLTLSFRFVRSHTQPPQNGSALYRQWVQKKNNFFCRLYQFATRPFTAPEDQILYLYRSLPFCFRRMMQFRYRQGKKTHA